MGKFQRMCAEYEIRTRKKQIDESLGRSTLNKSPRDEWHARIKLTDRAPILVMNGDQIEIIESVFPVKPFPNARLSTLESDLVKPIYDRPTWALPFVERRAIALMSSFYEPAYWGEHAGQVMRFEEPNGGLLFVAAIQISATFPKTTQAHALLTHSASEQMLSYHHRLIVLLKAADALTWLEGGKADPEEKLEFLLRHQVVDDLSVASERKMAKGWEKRVDEHNFALASEERYRLALKKT